jgi:lysophospholipid acyltransferase (LPLAT)-like uncharacterized protein
MARQARRAMSRRLLLLLFGWVTSVALRLLGATWRVEILGRDPRVPSSPGPPIGPQLAALFHESLIAAAWLYRDQGYSVAVSRSRDGSLISSTLDGLGYAESARGSSSRGGSAALSGLLRSLGAGTTVAVLVDGPRGPARIAKPGIAALARLTATPVQPVAFAARPALRLRSWDRSLVPLPFARVVCAYGEPIAPGEVAEKDREREFATRVEERLAALHAEAEARLFATRKVERR